VASFALIVGTIDTTPRSTSRSRDVRCCRWSWCWRPGGHSAPLAVRCTGGRVMGVPGRVLDDELLPLGRVDRLGLAGTRVVGAPQGSWPVQSRRWASVNWKARCQSTAVVPGAISA
jgi:hypothetical protein